MRVKSTSTYGGLPGETYFREETAEHIHFDDHKKNLHGSVDEDEALGIFFPLVVRKKM